MQFLRQHPLEAGASAEDKKIVDVPEGRAGLINLLKEEGEEFDEIQFKPTGHGDYTVSVRKQEEEFRVVGFTDKTD